MTDREAFLQRLAEDENDTIIRFVYADWLDNHGEHEEADRQRRWPMAKAWLLRFCEENSAEQNVSVEHLIAFGQKVVEQQADHEPVYIDDPRLWEALKAHSKDFWRSWAIVTGIPLPANMASRDFHHWSCCDWDQYYWFGLPSEITDE